MDGQGPGAGNPKKLGYVLASSDALALDAVAVSMVGLKNVPILYLAKKRGLLQAQLKNIEVIGRIPHVKDFKKAFDLKGAIPTFLLSMMRGILTRKPVANKDKCVKCGHCAEVCPKKAISMEHGFPEINYHICIRCYCCHEFCPHKAMDLKKGFFLQFFRERFI